MSKPIRELTDEDILRECCEPCHHCKGTGEGGPIGKKIAAALGYDDSKCPYCNSKGHACELSPARIRAFAEQAVRQEREACAEVLETEEARILSKQTGKIPEVDTNLRMVTVMFGELAGKIRARGNDEAK